MKIFVIAVALIVSLPHVALAADVRSYSELRSAQYANLQNALNDFMLPEDAEAGQRRIERVRSELKSIREEFKRNRQTAILKCKPELSDVDLSRCLRASSRTKGFANFISTCFIVINLTCGEAEQVVKIPQPPPIEILVPFTEKPRNSAEASK